MSKDAMKMALDVLEGLQGGCTESEDGTFEAITVWCPEVIAALRAALAAPVAPAEPTAQSVHWGRLYNRANALCARIGADGSMAADAAEVEILMDALHDIDGGNWCPGIEPASVPTAQRACRCGICPAGSRTTCRCGEDGCSDSSCPGRAVVTGDRSAPVATDLPPGWAAKPKEPTQEMADAGGTECGTGMIGSPDEARAVWRAMFKAAPKVPQ